MKKNPDNLDQILGLSAEDQRILTNGARFLAEGPAAAAPAPVAPKQPAKKKKSLADLAPKKIPEKNI